MVVTIACNLIATGIKWGEGCHLVNDPLTFCLSLVFLFKSSDRCWLKKSFLLKQKHEKIFLPGLQSLIQSVILLFVFSL